MQHMPYQLFIHDIMRAHKRKRRTQPDTPQGMAAVAAFLKDDPETNGPDQDRVDASLNSHAMELHWLNTGRHTYYFEHLAQAQSLMAHNSHLKTLAGIYDKTETFMLMLPKELKIVEGIASLGCLVNVRQDAPMMREIIEPYRALLGVPHPFTVDDLTDPNKYSVQILSRFKVGKHLAVSSDTYTDHELLELSKATDFESYRYLTDRYDDLPAYLDAEFSYNLTRLVLGFLLYRKALPEKIIDGFPGELKRRPTSMADISGVNYHAIGSPGERGQVIDHYRRAHFRQLVNPKFYKGEHANAAPGSRVVYVTDAYIGKKQTPHTAT